MSILDFQISEDYSLGNYRTFKFSQMTIKPPSLVFGLTTSLLTVCFPVFCEPIANPVEPTFILERGMLTPGLKIK